MGKQTQINNTSTVCRNEKYAYKQKGMLLRTELEVSAWWYKYYQSNI